MMDVIEKEKTLRVIREVEVLLLDLEKQLQEKRAKRITEMKKLKEAGVSCAEIGRNVGSTKTPKGLSRERVGRLIKRDAI